MSLTCPAEVARVFPTPLHCHGREAQRQRSQAFHRGLSLHGKTLKYFIFLKWIRQITRAPQPWHHSGSLRTVPAVLCRCSLFLYSGFCTRTGVMVSGLGGRHFCVTWQHHHLHSAESCPLPAPHLFNSGQVDALIFTQSQLRQQFLKWKGQLKEIRHYKE